MTELDEAKTVLACLKAQGGCVTVEVGDNIFKLSKCCETILSALEASEARCKELEAAGNVLRRTHLRDDAKMIGAEMAWDALTRNEADIKEVPHATGIEYIQEQIYFAE